MPSENPLARDISNDHLIPFLEVVNFLTVLDKEVPLQVIRCFTYIASHDGCHKLAMEQDLEMMVAAGSRNTDWLSDKHRFKKPGLGLIRKERDPTDRRQITLHLTDKGKDLAKRILSTLYV